MTYAVVYLVAALAIGAGCRWIDQTGCGCGCGAPAARRGWPAVTVAGVMWPALVVLTVVQGLRRRR